MHWISLEGSGCGCYMEGVTIRRVVIWEFDCKCSARRPNQIHRETNIAASSMSLAYAKGGYLMKIRGVLFTDICTALYVHFWRKRFHTVHEPGRNGTANLSR